MFEIANVDITGRMVHGEGTAEVLERTIHGCASPDVAMLIINLAGVSLMDAAGLSALVLAYRAAQSVGAEFRLEDVPPRIKQLLAITRLDNDLPDS